MQRKTWARTRVAQMVVDGVDLEVYGLVAAEGAFDLA